MTSWFTIKHGGHRQAWKAVVIKASEARTWHRLPPHSVDWQAHECTSCHARVKSLGYGTHDGRYLKGYAEGVYVVVVNEKGEVRKKLSG